MRLRCESLPESNCVQGQAITATQAPPAICQPITVPLCKDLPHTETILPNILGHKTQEEAGLGIHQFLPLVNAECSPYLKPFLCSVYVPKCVSERPQPPCRTLCEQARSGCASLMSSFGFQWPDSFRCEAFTTESCEQAQNSRNDRTSCKPVTSSFCQGLGYTTTLHPSGVQGYNLQQIGQMVETACSPHIATLMCRVVVPECNSEDDSRKKPCRALCEKVKKDCESTLRIKRLTWPMKLRCDSLPESNCVQVPSIPVNPVPSQRESTPAACQAITLRACEDQPYSETILPNILGHDTQVEAGLEIHQFYPFIEVECSRHLKPFLCSVYVPKCVSGRLQPPCRLLCELARSGCATLMNNFGFHWPESLKCEAFTTESCGQTPFIGGPETFPSTCQAITIPFCKDLPYTETALPGVTGHKTQEDASLILNTFTPLVQFGCSSHLKPFLCSVYLPKCVSGKAQPPCRTLCEQVRASCEPLMNRFGFSWPETLNCVAFSTESCEQYGVSTSGGICEPISIPVCQGLSYNQTIVPNLLGHKSQREAVSKMSFFNSMVQAVCSTDIRLFLCRVYAPQCIEGKVQMPCRSFCEKAKRDCESLMNSFGVSWPEELQCKSFPEEMCISEESRAEMLKAEDVLAKLKFGGYTVRGKSLTLRTARLLLILMDADKTGDLNVVELFKLEHYVAIIRRDYVEKYESTNPPAVTQTQMKKTFDTYDFHVDEETFRALWFEYHSQGGIDYDNYMAVLTRLHILKGRFQAHLQNLPCDCQVASFSFKQFMKSAII
ncbi:atrial natriuretic peptide-converting enzyme-like [Melanotaenia boesemani]|uniref:atrial natriuretic peptide-converting enzyme-like n=1 Tax=Melanotaenia boesemani TaxID=1250792 RepID=UPI001C041804|nr:atrial natriuretic peptide-converting enzyme-like [Melanotaenia boesemani]